MTTQALTDPFRWQCVYVAEHSVEAHIICGLLSQAGIQTQLTGAALYGAMGEIPFTELQIRILVYAIKLPRAQQILLNYHQQLQTHWHCPSCQEENGPAFDYCWSCETQKE
ncbi:hypothetical protein PALB_3260 [Pseudoalteromonas luteoviolacea B = ATCC 29581]|nr:hypothetical protein PALB_3260 [Pseudoalteromonas luteoviolacea B = ATCC 29581]